MGPVSARLQQRRVLPLPPMRPGVTSSLANDFAITDGNAMTLNVEAIRSLSSEPVTQVLTKRDAILYALSVGAGSDPTDRERLKFVFEPELQVLPSICNVLCHRGFWARDPQYGVDWVKLLHADQFFEVLAPLAPEGTIVGNTRVTAIEDKGERKGALLYQLKELHDGRTAQHLANVRTTLFLRGNGGQGSFGQAVDAPAPLEDREPDRVIEVPTRPDQALLYRLNGDVNPLHIDPDVARRAGFDRPILHGLCTNGIATRVIIESYGADDAKRLRSLFVRFSNPVYPGERLRFEFYEGATDLRFRAVAPERNTTVLDRCSATLA